MPPPPSPPPPSPPPPVIELDFDHANSTIDQVIYHADDTFVVFSGTVRNCDVVIFVRKDMTDDMDPADVCTVAPHLLTISEHHKPPEHGGRLYSRPDLGVYTEVALYGVHDSDDPTDPDPDLESTGTYSICHAPFPDHMPATECHTWTPGPGNYSWYPTVQLHVEHKPPSMPPAPEQGRHPGEEA